MVAYRKMIVDLLSRPANWASENTVLAFLLLPGLPGSEMVEGFLKKTFGM